MSEMSDMIRKNFKAADDIRDAGLTEPEGIWATRDVIYGTDPDWQVLDVYRPDAPCDGQKLPVIVSVHGGGWVYGDKELYKFYCMDLALRGFAVVNYTYRLAPEFKFPSSMEDTGLVFDWVISHAEEMGFDTDHIFAVGDSAGAHLLGLYSCALTGKEYQAKYPTVLFPDKLVLQGIALNCGAFTVDMDESKQDGMTPKLMRDLLPGGATPEEVEMITVTNHVTQAFPTAFVMTATGDFLAADAPKMVETLIQHKIPHQMHFYGNSEVELGHVFHLNMKSEAARGCNDDECAFFRSLM